MKLSRLSLKGRRSRKMGVSKYTVGLYLFLCAVVCVGTGVMLVKELPSRSRWVCGLLAGIIFVLTLHVFSNAQIKEK